MCPVQFRAAGPPRGSLAFMTVETFRRLLAEMPALEELHLQGLGERPMHPRLFAIVRRAGARGVRARTNTHIPPPRAESWEHAYDLIRERAREIKGL